MSFPDYVSAQGPVPIPARGLLPMRWFSLFSEEPHRVIPNEPVGHAWGNAGRMVGDCLTTLPLG